MKTRLLTFIILFVCSILTAQEVSYLAAENVTGVPQMRKADHETNGAALATAHNEYAVKSILHHLSDHLVYPLKMREQGEECKVVAEVAIGPSGSVQLVSVHRSSNPLFEQAVKTAMERLPEISFGEGRYHGPDRLFVPVRFEIDL